MMMDRRKNEKSQLIISFTVAIDDDDNNSSKKTFFCFCMPFCRLRIFSDMSSHARIHPSRQMKKSYGARNECKNEKKLIWFDDDVNVDTYFAPALHDCMCI